MSASAVVIRLACFAAVVLAWALVRVAPAHRPAARTLTTFLVIDLARAAGRGRIPRLLDASLFLGAYAVQAGLALRVFPRVHPTLVAAPGAGARVAAGVVGRAVQFAPWAALVAWVGAVGALAGRWDIAVEIYRGAFYGALAVQVIAVVLFIRRRPRELPGPAQGVSALLALSACADVVGPWFNGRPVANWKHGAATALLTWIAIVAWEAWRWTVLSRR